ncbi:hypothetical protein SAMN02910298_02586 [Pseudobutyrivibrio sp. YE44]|uniref:hypothetical protein n=1 Tax=Pseudobutyrivibrio sp. YE44 TaxID=1520802 RepID=UPI00088E4C30|nr:hypothetical protein [Pseudobutyrivibrio sp. YE44]SDB50786.1 hypothetical protein SAMN02910298_02586 [Pseudobutyrivibrio sp. YE44]
MSREFNEALGNFITDFAGGGAVRHLADQGLTVSEIMGKLDYPLPKEKVAEIVWQHYINTGVVCLEEPGGTVEKVSYVKEQDSFGKTSMRRVVEKIDMSDVKYVKVDFGKRLYQNPEGLKKSLAELSAKDCDYVLDLPWPLQEVFHIKDDRMKRICKTLNIN